MAKSKATFAWDAISPKLQREKKANLIQLIQELTAASPEAQRFLQTRYLKKKKTADQIAPYRQVIKHQFVISEWSNTISWNFAGVQKAIDDYTKSSQGDEMGISELIVVALETAVTFADNLNLHDDDFEAKIAELAEKCVDLFRDHSSLYSRYSKRVEKVEQIGNQLGFYTLGEILDELTNPYR